ncbi:type VII secretion protein EccB [Mycolicibacterium arseniciresistens]|uniref:Type VII secretion protein EccB n=1 Tax=Mycolicibacterium arseniciresistens TaxID=3062257 RepID=A0ABT8UIN2_9MYCO|nr:type VII secretion protein EccB [Mycolicibacterium arseniciresistens]MDO3637655.1 type VII secretion protein EccB [Mycolicibacterium arseniciresistens]
MAESRERTTTRLQVSAHRFLTRRMQHALVRGDVRMLDDPLRAQSLSLTAGAVLAVIAIAGCAVLAFLRPQGAIDGATIVTVRESGALYVRIGDTIHPVPNLASARLVAGAADDPTVVSEQAVASARRGPMVGIAGAPTSIGTALPAAESIWDVCDSADRTIVRVGSPADAAPFGSADAVLVAPVAESAATTYLLHAGRRAQVDLRDRAVARALRLDGRTPRPVSRTLLDTIPEDPPIVAPTIPGAGSAGPAPLGGYPVGTVVRLARAEAAEHYVVLTDGVQRIGEVTADLIRLTVTQPHRDIPTVAATALAAAPSVETLPVATFPARVTVVDPPVLCARWHDGGAPSPAGTTLWRAEAVPSGPGLVALAQADGAGPGLDAVEVPAGRSLFVRAVGVGGSGGSAGPLYLVDDLGVVFGVRDVQTAQHLGLPANATPAPWPVLARLPRGPELSRDRASVLHDAVAGPGPG